MTTSYRVEGMHCESCVAKISAALRQVPGVLSARVSLSPPRAEVEADGPIPLAGLNGAVGAAGAYALKEPDGAVAGEARPQEAGIARESLYPLALIVVYIAGTVVLIAAVTHDWSLHRLMGNFMGGFFLVFSFFKLLDIRGFAEAYRSYDLIAQRAAAWGFIYPFVELALGAAYIAVWQPVAVSLATLIVMLAGAVGVFKALLNKRAIRCACLGTVLNLPMTKVTLIEDLGMAFMAGVMLVTV